MELKVGSFYWILIALDPDGEDWENKPMPARYTGDGQWATIGCEDHDWPVIWVGDEIKLEKN